MSNVFSVSALLLPALLLPAPLLAQDPSLREIQEIARRVDEQLREIDRLLLESSKARGEGQRPQELLQQSRQQSEVVEQGIDDLIAKLTQMKNQSPSSQSDQQQQQQQQQRQQQQDPSQQQRPQNRRENPDQEFMPQGQQQQGEQQQGQQQQQQQQANRPEGPEQNPPGGENREGNLPPDQATGPGQPGTGDDEWGKLQPYVNFLKNQGSPPKVPEKYRKYWEAYLKQRGDKR